MKIGVIGAGRLGICFALLCEQAGYDVLVSDIREDYVNDLNQKKITTNEPEVEDLLRVSKNFRATTNNKEVIDECDLIYTLVQTPSNDDGSYDVSAVWQVVSEFSDVEKRKYLVIGCTTNPGDCDQFTSQLPSNVKVLYNPEFIAQGSIVSDLKKADMVLLGIDQSMENDTTVKDINNLYKKIQINRAIVCTMSTKSAEITKIAVNCFLTTKVSYANQVGQVMIKDGLESEVNTVLNAIGSDTRIGRKYLGFGFGFGGPCFPRDNRAFASYARAVGVDHAIGETTDNFNNEHSNFLRDYYVNKNKKELPFCFKYLTYKPGIDILTESRPYDLALALLEEGYKVYCIDETCKDIVDKRIKFTAAPIEPVCWIDL